jgi:uncharacterized heparinase superfamily protein
VTGTTAATRIVCVTEHEHRSRAIADDVLAGRFTVAGETRALGADPDWLSHAGLPEDEEWRIEWVKFAWGLDLAHAAEETGDPAYAHAWERLTREHVRRVPPDADPAEVTARRILNWIYAGQRLGALQPLAASLAEQVAHVRANLAPDRNHRTLELYALFVAALALPGHDGNLEETVALLDDNLATDFRPDGVHREASTHYHAIALRSLVGARENARRNGIALPDGFDDRLARAVRFLLHCTRPNGTIPALSDADTGDYWRVLAMAADLLGEEPPGASFPDGGYHVQRSGWDAGARYLIFDCGPLGDGGHGHYDLLSLEAHANGRPLVLDPGRGSYSEAPPNLRRRFRSTAAHNTVCVDGLDQTPYTRGRPDGAVATGRLLHRDARTLVGEAISPAYDAVHRRAITFHGDRWVIEDTLRGTREHRYDLRFHLPPGGGPDALTIEGADEITVEPGWIAPSYGVLLDAPVVSAVATGKDARFVTVLHA